MTVQAFIVLDTDQKNAAAALNSPDAAVMPQVVTNTLANNLGFGTLVGLFVLPARLLNDPAYAAWVPSLGTLPIHIMDSETLFVPVTLPWGH
ncbi:hypothetical protein AB4037_08605 [Labrys sp. KB_33_2]|uniref:hypothetical protein n=1 Tax=Labrys sp. KB_33_2 TaxID=3237479 RepID=UPI003F9021D0